MAEYTGRSTGNTNSVTREYLVTSGASVYDGEFVRLDSNGFVSSASIASGRILGTVVGGPANANALATEHTYTNPAVGDGTTVTVLVNIEQDARYLIKCDNVTNTLRKASEGRYYNLIGSPGSQLVGGASESTTTGQLVCIKFNPGIRGTDATYGLFQIAQAQLALG